MEENSFWRCPNCDTLNSSEVCVVCKEHRPLQKVITVDDNLNTAFNKGKQVGYAEAEADFQYSKKRIAWIIVILSVLLISIPSFVCYLIFFLNSSSMSSEENVKMNANAQIIYKAALDYCINCYSCGNKVEDGILIESFIKEKEDVSFDGSYNDIRNYLNTTIGQDSKQYYCIVYKNGTPEAAAWGVNPFNTDNEIITQDSIINENQIVGLYPPYSEIDLK